MIQVFGNFGKHQTCYLLEVAGVCKHRVGCIQDIFADFRSIAAWPKEVTDHPCAVFKRHPFTKVAGFEETIVFLMDFNGKP